MTTFAYIIGFCLMVVGSHAMLRMTVDGDSTVTAQILGDVWFNSSYTSFHINNKLYSTLDGSLKVNSTSRDKGSDLFGPFSVMSHNYAAGDVLVGTSVRLYDGRMAIFSQDFPMGAMETSVGNKNGIVSAFPAFEVGTQNTSLGVLAFGEVFSGYTQLTIERWCKGMPNLPGGLASGPIVLFDTHNNVVILSAFNHFTAASYQHNNHANTIAWGIMGNVDSIPKGYTLQTIMYYSNEGINVAMQQWGSVMREYYGRTSAARDTDVTINYLGYYTDNGAYYYNVTEPNKTYEQTLFDVYNDSLAKNIPYKYLQLDDWWYFIETSTSRYGAVTRWEPRPSVFPHGLEYLYDVMKWPVIAHNRFWSYKTPYAKQNGGSWDFLLDPDSGMALPMEEEFWDWLFYKSKGWGLVNYEQDFMCTQMEELTALNTNITLAETWLKQMGNAAARYNLKLQYCMALPREILAALEIHAVSQARASKDYINVNQWEIGITSMFLDALHIAPFKDNFWTTKVEPGNRYRRVEVNPVREAVVALLSTGPVGVSDKYGLTNTSITTRLSRSDGLLLKPGRAATAIDSQIWQKAFGGDIGPNGDVYASVYSLAGLTVGVIFASELHSTYTLYAKQAGLHSNGVWNWAIFSMDSLDPPKDFTLTPAVLDNCGAGVACVYYVSPRFDIRGASDLVIMGELSKYVPLSPQRVLDISWTRSDVTMLLQGAMHERVSMYFYANKKVFAIDCVIGASAQARLSFKERRCYSF